MKGLRCAWNTAPMVSRRDVRLGWGRLVRRGLGCCVKRVDWRCGRVLIRSFGGADFWVLPNGRSVPPSAGDLITPSNQGLAPGWARLRRVLTPATLRGPAPNGHPCPDGALAASMPLDPLRIACVQPARKSRFVAPGLSRYEDQKREQEQCAASLLILPKA